MLPAEVMLVIAGCRSSKETKFKRVSPKAGPAGALAVTTVV